MLTTERDQFDEHAKVLFAGCNLPATPERIEAFWRGLQLMSLGGFVRVVEFVLGEHGPENLQKITVQQLWHIHRQQRARIEHAERAAQHKPVDMATESRRISSNDSLRSAMPKTRSGHIVHPDYLPPHQRAEYAQRWNEWADKNPGVIEKVAV